MLRRTLENGDSRIETIPKRGYRLIALVRTHEPAVIPTPVAKPASRGRTKWIAVIVLAVAVAAAVSYLSLRPAAVRALAVLPLQNLSGNLQDEYLADGLTELLIGDLAKIGALRVISRTSSDRKSTRLNSSH